MIRVVESSTLGRGTHSDRVSFDNRKSFVTIAAATFFVAAVFVSSVSAQPKPLADEEFMNRFDLCANIGDSLERLVCYDQLRDGRTQRQTRLSMSPSPAPDVVQNNEVEDTGLRGVEEHELGDKYLPEQAKKKSAESVTVTIVSAERDSEGRWQFVLKNGQVWRQLEARYLKVPRGFPADAIITPGALGSFSLKIGDDGKSVKIKRVK